jgi:hypothetical protein
MSTGPFTLSKLTLLGITHLGFQVPTIEFREAVLRTFDGINGGTMVLEPASATSHQQQAMT